MKPYTSIQKYFWQRANFDCFIMGYCPVMYNRVASIGVIFNLQLVVAFVVGFISYKISFNAFPFIGVVVGSALAWVYSKWIYYSCYFQHKQLKLPLLFLILFSCILFTTLFALPLILLVFQSQVEFELFKNSLTLQSNFSNTIWQQIVALYYLKNDDKIGIIVSGFSFGFYFFILLLLFLPYFLIYQARKSIYFTLLKSYEQNYCTSK